MRGMAPHRIAFLGDNGHCAARLGARGEVRRKISIALDQAERGDVFDGEEVFRELLEKL
jgi:hypothetical protein